MVLLVALVAVLTGAQPATSGAPAFGPAYYVVRPDPRLCPSPLCGGYWASLGNRARTECSDGMRRPRCYVARAISVDRHPLDVAIPAGALVRAELEPWAFEGFGELGILVVADVFAPIGRARESGGFFRLADTGVRCVRAPCFSVRASRLNRLTRTTVSRIDLGPARTTPEERARVEAALESKTRVLAQGEIVPSLDGGRVFQATRFFLRSES
jgi:hypothetical protein